MIIAHLSDIHICNNRANVTRLFWDFLLVTGVPSVMWPLIKPLLASTRRQREVFRWLLRRPGAALNPTALAISVGVTLPLAIFLVRQFIRFRRIFYIRKDRPELRDSLIEDVRSLGARHVVITGDLTNIGDPAEFEMGAQMVSALGGTRRATVVPGNHDIDIQRMRRPARVSIPEKLDPYLGHLFVPKTFPKGIYKAKQLPFPFVRLLKPDICLICLDSTTFHPISNTRGALDEAQLDLLSDILSKSLVRDRLKIVLLHHHSTEMPKALKFSVRTLDRLAGRMDSFLMEKLKNAEELHEMLASGGVDLILHGHKHIPYCSDVAGVRVFCAGSATNSDPSGEFPPSYNLIRIERGRIEVSRRDYVEEGWEERGIPEEKRIEPTRSGERAATGPPDTGGAE